MKERVGGGELGERSLKGRILLNHRGSISRKVFRLVMAIGASSLPKDRLRRGAWVATVLRATGGCARHPSWFRYRGQLPPQVVWGCAWGWNQGGPIVVQAGI